MYEIKPSPNEASGDNPQQHYDPVGKPIKHKSADKQVRVFRQLNIKQVNTVSTSNAYYIYIYIYIYSCNFNTKSVCRWSSLYRWYTIHRRRALRSTCIEWESTCTFIRGWRIWSPKNGRGSGICLPQVRCSIKFKIEVWSIIY